MNQAPVDNRSPEEIAAGNRRALIGCGLILLVIVGAIVAGIMAFRYSAGSQGEACEGSSDCQPGFECADDAFRAVESVCRQHCDQNADCPSGRCLPVLGSDGGLCQ